MSQKHNQYIDEYQNIHIQYKTLGQGGQGIVFRTKDPDLAIKLVTDQNGNPVTDEEVIQKYSKRFKNIRLLPLPEGLNISVPVALIQNSAGYVMQLLSEMVPFSHFLIDGRFEENITSADIPTWLSETPENEAKKIVHYYKTGGLRRRLIALYKCASLLARLHGNSLVYGDISPHNIFISEGLEDLSVWLIDADNIRFETSVNRNAVYTPKYGAPELVQGKESGSPASDCYSFAIVAFYLLSLIHPFIGKKVDGTDESDWADDENDDGDLEEKAYGGFYPWVDDRNDLSNSSYRGLPRSLILTEKLKTLFELTFEQGRISPGLRPTIYNWPEALAQAADMTIRCPVCNMNYYYNSKTEKHNCPYCKALIPQILTFKSYRREGINKTLNSPCWIYTREFDNNSELTIPRRVFDEFTIITSDTPEVIISITEESILIKKTEQSRIHLSVALENHKQKNFQKVFSQLKIERRTPELCFWISANLNNSRFVLCTISGGKNEIERYKH